MPAKNRMSVSFGDEEWSLLERLAIHCQSSKSEMVRTIVSEYLKDNPNRFRLKTTLGDIRRLPNEVVANTLKVDIK